MARFLTPPVTVVQGDAAPDLVVTLQQDSSGTAFNLTDRVPFAVIVDTADPQNYVHKFQAQVDDVVNGKVRISWVKDSVEHTSYLDDLTPGKRYEVQLFLGRTDLPPSYIDVSAYYGYFSGRYLYTGRWTEGSPVYKHETEDLFMSRSPYSPGNVGDYAWIVTSLQEATWDQVSSQIKSDPDFDQDKLTEIPVWNYLQVLTGADVQTYAKFPNLGAFEPDPEYVITPDGKYATTIHPTVISVSQPHDNPGDAPVWKYTDIPQDGTDSYDTPRYFKQEGALWQVTVDHHVDGPEIVWEIDVQDGDLGDTNAVLLNEDPQFITVPEGAYDQEDDRYTSLRYDVVEARENFTATEYADASEDVENRGTQTVLTHIPLKVKTAYRLSE